MTFISVLFTAGYRVFFPLAALSSVVVLTYWTFLAIGQIDYLPSRFSALEWHQHEMIFGTVAAVITGFLFTAVPNWTGHSTPKGISLALLGLIWILGRITVFFSALFPVWLPIIMDGIFLPLAVMGILMPLIRSGNKRNYFLPLVLMLFASLNIMSHLAINGFFDFPTRQLFLPSVLFIVFLMNVIGGRIIPSFTKNKYPDMVMSTPAILLPLSILAIFGLALAFLLDAGEILIGSIAMLAGLFTLLRSLSWQGWKVAHDPLLFILHLGYLWIPIGFFLIAYSSFNGDVPISHALHAFTVGAIGSLTLGVMSRATLGHSGLPLKNEHILSIMFLFVNVAAISRAILPLVLEGGYVAILQAAAGLWILAYGLFLVRFARIFMTARKII
ncbi:MAG: NnrS family protein [Emcibacter sp.]|nr:NnrS family protein [Emcibacter sp.]